MTMHDCRIEKARTRPARLVFAVAALCAGLFLSGCNEPVADHPSVSEVPIEAGEPIRQTTPPSRVEIYYGEGDCAPRFPNGMMGTCINNQPCNGFGFKDDKGEWQCGCFATTGGCKEGSICSMRARGCTGEADADFKRQP